MFRRPTEIDSDSGSSSSSESDNGEESIPRSNEKSEDNVEFNASNTLSLSVNDEASQEASGIPVNATYHGHMIVATLLEELAKTRAAELLNNGSPGAGYTRFSPDVQPVAQRMFRQASRMLSSNGILPTAFAGDELRDDRKQYLNGLEQFGLQALQDTELHAAGKGQLPSPNKALVVTDQSRTNNDPSTWLSVSMQGLGLRRSSLLSYSSPQNDMQLSTTTSTATRSRFRSEFQEIRILGKGGFGQVHHVVNFVDNQHYAIKRVPLSPNMSKRWQETGLEELDHVLREIRTLARLEHCNIVRYYNAWIESPIITPISTQKSSLANLSASRKLLNNHPALKPRPNLRSRLLPPIEDGSGISFRTGSISKLLLSQQEIKVDEASINTDTDLTESLRDSEVFSDGKSRASSACSHPNDPEDVYVLNLQMSIHTATLTTYLSRTSADTRPTSRSTCTRHCFHIMPSLRLLLGILCGLQYLHTMQIVHRDIKPGNILLSECVSHTGIAPAGYCEVSCHACPDRQGLWMNPRIADFGLSTMTASPGRSKIVGTEFYHPPSSIKGKELTSDLVEESLDVFALGIVLFELLWPFSTKMERYHLLTDLSQHGRLPESFVWNLDSEKAGVGETIAACILGMVSQDPNERWTCDRVKQSIDDVLQRCQQEEQFQNLNRLQDAQSNDT